VLEDVRERGVLQVGMTFDYRPFSYLEDGVVDGIDVELARALAAAMDVRLDWIETSWPTLSADVEARRFDIAMSGISVTPARAATGTFTAPYFRTGKSLLVRCIVADRFTSLADVDRAGVRVIVNPGGTNEAFVNERLRRAEVVRHPDNVDIFAALERGAADAMITDAVEADVETRRHPGLCHRMQPPYLSSIEKAWLLPRDDAWRAYVDAWLAKIAADGTLAAAIESGIARAAAN
jgi:cyclohexadienyl dehydratase